MKKYNERINVSDEAKYLHEYNQTFLSEGSIRVVELDEVLDNLRRYSPRRPSWGWFFSIARVALLLGALVFVYIAYNASRVLALPIFGSWIEAFLLVVIVLFVLWALRREFRWLVRNAWKIGEAEADRIGDHLYKTGRVTTGEVVGFAIDDGAGALRYRFTDAAGTVREKRYRTGKAVDHLRVGDAVAVLYDERTSIIL